MHTKPAIIRKFEDQFLVNAISNGSLSELNDGKLEFVAHLPNTSEGEVGLFADVHGLEMRDDTASKKFVAYNAEGGLTLTIIWDKLFFDKFVLAIRICNEQDGFEKAEEAYNVFRSVFRLGTTQAGM